MESPDEFEDVQDSKEARVSEIPVVVVFDSFGAESYMLESDESDESCHEEDEERNVTECAGKVMKESSGVFEEDSLKFEFIIVEAHHAYN